MNFADLIFWVILLPSVAITLAGRMAVRALRPGLLHQYDALALAATSLILLYFAGPLSFRIFVVEVILTYGALHFIHRAPARARAWLCGALAFVLLLPLIYYKYSGFLFGEVLHLDLPISTGEIPPGISFYTFQLIAFAVDTTLGHLRMPPPLAFVNFISFFATLVAGPIERRAELQPQMERFRYRITMAHMDLGLRTIVLGLFFKLVLADHLANFGSELRPVADNSYFIWLATILFGLRIYYDFAGYSLIAVGLAQVLGITLDYNFLAPYVSKNVQEFWRRWHRTLSSFFRDYVYVPLGGSRVPWVAFNLLFVFVISGLWHGAGYNFLLWGFAHGLLLVIFRALPRGIALPRVAAWMVTCVLVTFTWLLFYETDVQALSTKLAHLVDPGAYAPSRLRTLLYFYNPLQLAHLGALLIMVGAVLAVEHVNAESDVPYRPLMALPVAVVLVFLTVWFRATEDTGFMYFAF